MLYGRDVERQAIGELLEAARESRSSVVVVRGAAGIGKSALLDDARDRAADMHVLSVRGVESETELPFAGLHQLLRPALGLVDQLPGPQASALQGALGLIERSGDDRFLISAAVLTLLSELAEQRPVLCLVDDAQWLDTPSSDALLFVARRLDAEGVVMLFAAREEEDRRFDARGIPDLALEGLDSDAARHVIARNSDGAVSDAVRELLVAQASGNALALIELPSALTPAQLAGTEPLPETLPLTRDVERLYLDRVRRMDAGVQRLLLVVAADDTGQLGRVLRAAAALGIGDDALASAELAGLLSVHGTHVDVRHPLIRSAVYQGSTSGERRAVHAALATAFADADEPDQSAWHRAAAALGADETIADELESAADRARLRGGYSAAATALERAAAVTVDPAAGARRLVASAGDAWRAGQTARAAALLQRAAPQLDDPRLRADSDHILGLIGLRRGNLIDAGAQLIAGAASVAPFDPHKAFEMLVDAGSVAGRSGHSARMAEVGRMVAALPRSSDAEDDLLADLLVGVGGLIEGKTADAVPLIADAVVRAHDSDDTRLLSWAATGASTIGDHSAEAALLRRAVAVARRSNAIDNLVLILETVVSAAVVSGRGDLEAEAVEGLGLATEAGLTNASITFQAALAWSAALAGDEDACRSYAAEVARSVQSSRLANANSTAEWGVAVLDLSIGRAEAAHARLTALAAAPLGIVHPFFVLMFTPDLVEAYVRTGHTAEAATAFAALDAFAQPGAPAWALAGSARCRALLSDDAATTQRELSEAARLYGDDDRLFERARAELLLGEHLRRGRQRVEAREHLRSALDGFEGVRAARWAERARTELRASGETARRRDPSTVAQLTPQELQVARFVADGLSNKEVAAQLFLSPRTVDAHLRNVFAKLEITSRTQLAKVPLPGVTEAPLSAA